MRIPWAVVLREVFFRLIPEYRITAADEFYRVGKELGYDFPRHAFREAWKEINVETHYRHAIANLPPDRPIPRAWYTPTTSEQLERYTYTYSVTIRDRETGWEEHVRGFYTGDKPLTAEQAREIVKQYVEESPQYQDWDVVELEFYAAYRK